MNIWWRRILIVMTVGGSFFGLNLAVIALSAVSGLTLLIYVALVAYFTWGVVLGLALTEGRIWVKQLVAFLALQIPYLNISGFEYHAWTALGALAGDISQKFGIRAEFGSSSTLSWGGNGPLEIAVNIVPIVLVVVLVRTRAGHSATAPATSPLGEDA